MLCYAMLCYAMLCYAMLGADYQWVVYTAAVVHLGHEVSSA
jgi:hypothetical protein